jgi:hypothetical protein
VKENSISGRQFAKDEWAATLGPVNSFEIGSSLNGVTWKRFTIIENKHLLFVGD